jgi:hypothetical protein
MLHWNGLVPAAGDILASTKSHTDVRTIERTQPTVLSAAPQPAAFKSRQSHKAKFPSAKDQAKATQAPEPTADRRQAALEIAISVDVFHATWKRSFDARAPPRLT